MRRLVSLFLLAAAVAPAWACSDLLNSEYRPLAGKDKDEMLQKLLDFKNGRKPATLMHQLAKGYTDDELRAISAYFAAQKKQ